MKKLILLTAMATTALATPALARDKSWYVEGDVGATIVEDVNATTLSGTTAGTAKVDTKTGYDLGGIVGYDFGAFRLETEASYRRAALKTLTVGTASATYPAVGGKVDALSFMVNGLLDFGPDDGLQGFVGGGAGVARGGLKAATNAPIINDTDTGFAWQALAGIRAPISANVDLGLKYRYFNTERLDLVDSSGGKVSGKLHSHSLLATLTYNFGAAPAPVEAAPKL